MKIRWFAGDASFETDGCPPSKGDIIFFRNFGPLAEKKGAKFTQDPHFRSNGQSLTKFVVDSVSRSLACHPVALDVIRPKLTSSGDERYTEAMKVAETEANGWAHGFSADKTSILVMTEYVEVTLSEIITEPL